MFSPVSEPRYLDLVGAVRREGPVTGGRHAKNRFYAVTDVVIQCMDSRPSPHSPLTVHNYKEFVCDRHNCNVK